MKKNILPIHSKRGRMDTKGDILKNKKVAMQTASKIHKQLKKADFVYSKSPIHIYKNSKGNWRGFVAGYDVTYEAKTKKKVEEVIPKLVELYEEGLQKYGNPSHLRSVPLSDPEDRVEFVRWAETIAGK